MKRRTRGAGGERIEKDALGSLPVPAAAYYGIQTRRAMLNFPISSRRLPAAFVRAYAHIKRAAAEANMNLRLLDRRRGGAIRRAAGEILAGRHLDQFVVDVYQAGAGTSQNMNVNEVIANRAIEILGGRRGDYAVVHPNDHVNMSQSTNDTFPAALRISILESLPGLLRSLRLCSAALRRQSRKSGRTVKSARTHLQDAVPIMLGQEFGAFAAMVARAARRIEGAARPLHRLNLGATAAGTGINAHPRYARRVARILSRQTGLRLRPAENLVEAAMSTADFAAFSSALRGLALDLGKVANDLRLMTSGPTTGLAEIALPAVQPGSSIMPGKVNPVMCEMLNMVCFQVIGCDEAVSWASASSQFELNVMMPVMAHSILEAMSIVETAVAAFTRRCVSGIRADAARCRVYFERSPSLATALTPVIGYARAAELVKESLRTGRTIAELAQDEEMIDPRAIRRVLNPARLTRPGIYRVEARGRLRRRTGAAS
ncbi:MAG: aspartate ammonia-lyase, partial [Acidobacteria bacterium 13_1_40CM_4_69_4]